MTQRTLRLTAIVVAALTLGAGCTRAEGGPRPASLAVANPATAKAIDHVRSAAGGPKARALAIMKLVVNQIGFEKYAQLAGAHQALPTTTEQSLALHAGLCGNQAQAFVDLARKLGLPARSVEFYYYEGALPLSHIAVEARWSGRWHYLDTTTGATPIRNGDVMSLADLLADERPKARLRYDRRTRYLEVSRRQHNDPFDYLDKRPRSSLFVDGSGRLAPPTDENGSLLFPADVKNAFGTYVGLSGRPARTDIEVMVPDGRTQVAVAHRGAGGTGWLFVDDKPASQFSATEPPKTITFSTTPGRHVLSVHPIGDVAYLMLTRISFER